MGDGYLNMEEILTVSKHAVKQYNTEKLYGKATPGAAIFKAMDADKDGRICMEEAQSFYGHGETDPGIQMYKTIDSDGDGNVTKEEARSIFDILGSSLGTKGGKG